MSNDLALTERNALLGARATRSYHVYARAVDEGDLDALRALATDDVRITRGDHPTEDGVEAFLDVYRAHVAMEIPLCKHVVTNVLAEQQGEDVVTHAYFTATMFEAERTRVLTGVYDDVYREVDGELRLAHKKIRVECAQELPAAAASFTHVGK
ncbi:nuclear transport factor 2 family protein [Nocardioides zeae]|uniref:Nuclear transport factor 2 family protein n=1 Tax=Nocardioides imazamoxiresistens TaxID=3231893 RepID=A0ABU3PR36_9ACTN|nr:nuclear transport factor 2 family protein [Nocardioides zeae]MDT9591683.1 nuclear transport factor 2 family protein [Nocardioides zeae]